MTEPVPASLPAPPYYAVVFTAVLTDEVDGYQETDDRLMELAVAQPGFLGVDSARRPDGLGVTVSYWRDEESIAAWRDQAEHVLARARGHEQWYASFSLHVARVERAHGFVRGGTGRESAGG